jgi:hypothetical protein
VFTQSRDRGQTPDEQLPTTDQRRRMGLREARRHLFRKKYEEALSDLHQTCAFRKVKISRAPLYLRYSLTRTSQCLLPISWLVVMMDVVAAGGCLTFILSLRQY